MRCSNKNDSEGTREHAFDIRLRIAAAYEKGLLGDKASKTVCDEYERTVLLKKQFCQFHVVNEDFMGSSDPQTHTILVVCDMDLARTLTAGLKHTARVLFRLIASS